MKCAFEFSKSFFSYVFKLFFSYLLLIQKHFNSQLENGIYVFNALIVKLKFILKLVWINFMIDFNCYSTF